MSYRELSPPPALRPYVDRFWVRTPESVEGAVQEVAVDAGGVDGGAVDGGATAAPATSVLILPDGCIDVIIDVATGAARVVGTMTRAVVHTAAANTSLAAVRFRPGAACAFLRVPAAVLTDRVLGADELGCRWLSTRPAPQRATGAPERAVASLERSLLERSSAAELRREVRRATRRLFEARAPTVEALARELGRSRQHIARQFREHVGVGPKEFARVARLQRAIAAVQRSGVRGLAGLALDLGYFDQAHMSRDFNDLAGLTPRAARQARGSIFPIASLWLEP